MNKLDNFIQWMRNENFFLSSKISISNNHLSNYGLVAVDEINKDEVIFKIPRKSLLSIKNSSLYNKLINENVPKQSKWASLILCIFHELYIEERSQWKDYLDLFPNFSNLLLPMFWNDENLKLLKHTNLESSIVEDNESISKDFHDIINPFVSKYPDLFSKKIDLEMYKYYVAFVMAYSFTEDTIENADDDGDEDNENECEELIPYMVPMADVLNHNSYNNANLLFEKEELVMVAITHIKKDEEIFNTYGDLSNVQLLQMYGFTLPYEENKDDVVEMTLMDLNASDISEKTLTRIKLIKNISPEFLSVIIGKNGFLNTQELAAVINSLNMTDSDFQVFCDEISSEDLWEEENEEVEMMADQLDTFETVKSIPLKFRNILNILVNKQYQIKKQALANLTLNDNSSNLPCPKLFVKLLLFSHVEILENFIRITS